MSDRPTLYMVRRGATMNEQYARLLERVMVEVDRRGVREALGGEWFCLSGPLYPCEPDRPHEWSSGRVCHWAVPEGDER